MNLQAEVLRIRDVFSSGADLRVPPYQRGYAWGDVEVQALIKDLRDAFSQGTVYFVGAMVVIQTRKSGPSDVVDGQQRITTLTIILAVLRDLAASADEAASLHTMIGQGGFGWGAPQRWRVTLNHLDARFFRDNVQAKNMTLAPDAIDQAAESELQKRIARAVRLIHDEFSGDWTDEDRLRFARWLTDEVSVVKVRVSEHSIGYRVFLVLNKRGKPLSDHDIMKSAFFERAGFTDAEAVRHSHTWNEYANRLGSDAFEDMLKQIRFLYDRNMRGEFVETLLHVVMSSMPVSTFINQMLPRFVDAYDAVVLGNQDRMQFAPEVARSLCFLRSIHHESWRAPAIKYLVENPRNDDEAARFFAGLERLAYMMQYAVKERDYRHKRYRRVLDAMDQEGAIFDEQSPLAPTAGRKVPLPRAAARPFPQLQATPGARPPPQCCCSRRRSHSRRGGRHARTHLPAHATEKLQLARSLGQSRRHPGTHRVLGQLHPAAGCAQPEGRPPRIPEKARPLFPERRPAALRHQRRFARPDRIHAENRP